MEDTNRGKPDLEVFPNTAAGLRISPGRCLVMEDAPVGVQAAKAGGMNCIAAQKRAGLPIRNFLLLTRFVFLFRKEEPPYPGGSQALRRSCSSTTSAASAIGSSVSSPFRFRRPLILLGDRGWGAAQPTPLLSGGAAKAETLTAAPATSGGWSGGCEQSEAQMDEADRRIQCR